MTQRTERNGWRMLHPAALIVDIIDSIKATIGFLVVFIGIRIVRERDNWSIWIIIAIIVAVLAITFVPPIVGWLTTRYRLGADALELRTGLFSRKNRTISYATIHAIDSASPVYLQPFGVVRLTVSSAGSDANITLTAVPAALQLELESLRERSRATHDTDAIAEPSVARLGGRPVTSARVEQSDSANVSPANQPVFRASVRDILLFAITDLSFLAAALAIYAFADRIRDLVPRDWVTTAEQSVGEIVAQGVRSIILLALACVIVLMIVSIISALLRFYGFEVWRRGDDLVVVRGLFTRRTTTLPVSRIQTIMIRQSFLRQPFHLCSVSLGLSSSSSSGDDDDESNTDSANILPVVSTRRVIGLLREMLPEWDVREMPVQRTGRGLTRYYLTMPIVLGLVALAADVTVMIIAPGWLDGWMVWLIPTIIVAVFGWVTASRWLRSRVDGYAMLDDAIRANTADDSTDMARTSVANPTDLRDQSARLTDSEQNVVDTVPILTSSTVVPIDALPAAVCANPAHSTRGGVLPHRIMMTGADMTARFTLITRRSRVQSVTRSTTLWREPLGIERVEMPLFVTNGKSELTFLFLRRPDADRLAAWAEA
ncbi:Bacterial PH domain-containing protein [Bifidobacterium hapali]|uniref:Bacterial PH domain-containing protein n=1 Tax=Bifidobacterium hapali TaxID=1630172 RepID=A0A261FT23_9BIFI|nr:PH domain-containing protein [Bifidobacterium hapali]OZG62125.1 Bacterial PH domain-containing protein [Bifidobacterium hapali]